MSSSILAFQLAKPLESIKEESLGALYDPQAQTLIWQGGSRPLAIHCTAGGGSGYYQYCYDGDWEDYCNLSGIQCELKGYKCDNN